MTFDTLRWTVSRHPGRVVAAWVVLAVVVVAASPDLTRLAAEGQANLLPHNAESAIAARLVRQTWPDQAYQSLAVLALNRPGGLTDADHAFARRLAARFQTADRPAPIERVLGPGSPPEVAARLVSPDKSTQLLVGQLSTSFVGPVTHEAVRWLDRTAAGAKPPAGLELKWTGDAVIGRDYMRSVQQSLDRAAIVTVFLLLAVLLAVYRSIWLALIPLATIGISLAISPRALAWMTRAGWEVSPLVELFLVVILFGCGTDFCLLLSWRFGEHWNSSNPAGAMRQTLRRTIGTLGTSAGTVIVGLCLMGTTRFKLFSTGPSVALGLALTLAACLTLTPALLVLLAKWRPRAFAGLTRPSSGFWDEMGHKVLARPILTWCATVAVMLPLAVIGLRSPFIQDMFTELPASTPSVQNLRLVADKFGAGTVAPLTVVLKANKDLRKSEGLALIDDVSRLLAHQRRLAEVRSATQPLGSTKPLERARLSSRLGEISEGFTKIAEGAEELRDGLASGAGRIRLSMRIEALKNRRAATAKAEGDGSRRTAAKPPADAPTPKEKDPRETMVGELARAADGARQISEGVGRAQAEINNILADPVGRRALDRLLITPANVEENPELLRSFAAYIAPDGRTARIDLTPSNRMFSADALTQVGTLRRRLAEYLNELDDPKSLRASAGVAGPNAEAHDIQVLTARDQLQTWIIVPLGVFVLLVIALRDPFACVNLVATMLLTYAFALGATHVLFVDVLGSEGLDWKVPYFLFVLLVAVGVDYNVFLMARLQEESAALGLRAGINRAIAQTGGLISSAAAITACSFAAFLFSPLVSLRQLGFALVVGIVTDAVLVRPMLVPIGQWLMNRRRERRRRGEVAAAPLALGTLSRVSD